TGTLRAEHARVAHGVDALAVVDVDEVHASRLDGDEHLTGARGGVRKFVEGHDFGPAGGHGSDRSHDVGNVVGPKNDSLTCRIVSPSGPRLRIGTRGGGRGRRRRTVAARPVTKDPTMAVAPDTTAPECAEYARPERLVSTQWLAANLGAPGLVVVESDE